jgi:hypothetical protein
VHPQQLLVENERFSGKIPQKKKERKEKEKKTKKKIADRREPR